MATSIVVLGLALQDALGAAFGLLVVVWAMWCTYRWEIKPDREARRQRANEHIEKLRHMHRQQLGRTDVQRANAPSSSANDMKSVEPQRY
jgi:hypothetical protein